MSIYVIVLFLLLVSAIVEHESNTSLNILYATLFMIIATLLSLRYGQGTDYFGYYWHFDNDVLGDGTMEIGWQLLEYIFNKFGLPFESFIFVVSWAQMLLLNNFILKFCDRRVFALLIAFPSVILTYFWSGMREGLVIAIFVGILFKLLLERKYIKYCIGVLVCFLLHNVAIVLLVLPLLIRFKRSFKQMIILTIISFALGLFLFKTNLIALVPYGNDGMSITALLERLVTFAFLVYIVMNNENHDDLIDSTIDVYKYGVLAYGIFLGTALTASRIAVLFKSIEILLFSNLSKQKNKLGYATLIFGLVLSSFMTIKNLGAYVEQGGYIDRFNAMSYPYVSVFDKDYIRYIREIPVGYTYLLEK